MPSATPTERKCRKCGNVKPISAFTSAHFNAKVCLACQPPPPRHKVTDKERKCSHCGEVKPISEFKSAAPHSMVCLPCGEIVRKQRNNTALRRNAEKKREYNKRYSAKKRAEARKAAADGTLDASSLPPSAKQSVPKSEKRLEQIKRGEKHFNEGRDHLLNREVARRAVLRRSLLNFIANMSTAPGGYKAGWVHRLICAKLEQFTKRVENGESPRLMLFLPPRSGKSEIASKLFPAWYLGHHPDHELIACSYALSLPMEFSKKIKAAVQTKEYEGIFPHTRLSRDSQATEGWRTTRDGGYVAAGVQGPITGKGAHVLIVDDPVKDADEADSETIREKVWSWWGSTARTRLAPGGGVLLIMTRWHDDDLAGRILRRELERRKEIDELLAEAEAAKASEEEVAEIRDMYKTLEGWEVISFEALADSDEWWDQLEGRIVYEEPAAGRPHVELRKRHEALHPDRFPRHELLKLKHTLQPRHWNALYQQNPTPDEGTMFTKSMFRFTPGVVDYSGMYTFAAWDLAIGQKTSNDYTVGVVGAVDWNGDVFLLEMIRARMQQQDIAEAIVDTAVKYGVSQVGIERGQLELAMRPILERLIRDRHVSVPLAEGKDALVPITDKVVRARPLQGLMQQGKLHLPRDQDWAEVLMAELLRFPNGVYDDIVDAVAWLARLVLKHGRPVEPTEKFKVTRPSWKDKLRQLQRRKHFMAA